ncbi:TetR family transcriptional regulator [Novosphingobium sp. FSY-8]|uniref:TetR family transcriptional regulator n=1 Tax=Novosphingobium ovatum TaxID=1908523 RepID=A0ABW9XFT5_9SPHN|nr:TetR/AcrR family transcriptional regulator C-terminal domain-containing protein [Novosphingobium ovatum]NBC37402.1 TetR family transcriptional regulator [Novosphingobium ovatum]
MTDAVPPTAKQLAAQARCAAMVAHARAQIMAVGVQRFNLNAVLREAGGSKATLAKYFGDKTGLIAAAIGEEAREAMAALVPVEPARGQSLEQTLQQLLAGVLRFYLQPGALALYRAVIAMADQTEHAAAAGFYAAGHGAVVDAIAHVLTSPPAALSPDAARAMADTLTHAIRAGVYERALLGLEPLPVADAAIAAQVAHTLALCLPGIIAAQG